MINHYNTPRRAEAKDKRCWSQPEDDHLVCQPDGEEQDYHLREGGTPSADHDPRCIRDLQAFMRMQELDETMEGLVHG